MNGYRYQHSSPSLYGLYSSEEGRVHLIGEQTAVGSLQRSGSCFYILGPVVGNMRVEIFIRKTDWFCQGITFSIGG